MLVKLCGMRSAKDITYCNMFLPDYIGFVFAQSPRRVSMMEAAMLRQMTDRRIKTVGVFVNTPIDQVVACVATVGLSAVQLHGEEDALYIRELKRRLKKKEVIRAVRVQSVRDILEADRTKADFLLLDAYSSSAYGGTGETAAWEIIKNCEINKPFFLAGGLNESNLVAAAREVKPTGLDLSSGLETDGYKDFVKIRRVMTLARSI